MIHLISQAEAERQRIRPSLVQSISPYTNPAHVLAPPRHWLEALADGRYGWALFRLRYKTLLRDRFREEPARFFALLDASQGGNSLFLTCRCAGQHCHGEVARAFLETLRAQRPQPEPTPQPRASRHTGSVRAERSPRLPHPSVILSTLIEHPARTTGQPG